MDSKILNFVEAMEIAKLILNYFKVEEIENLDGLTFGYILFDRLSIEEIQKLSFLLLENVPPDPRETIHLCVTSMVKNNIIFLLNSYKQLGFK